jgi:hypothetical protein
LSLNSLSIRHEEKIGMGKGVWKIILGGHTVEKYIQAHDRSTSHERKLANLEEKPRNHGECC